ncbi:MAG TPA: hypothetical protein VH599_04735 [Ktedonobacterales bacterium]|jgi:hypothetical protein
MSKTRFWRVREKAALKRLGGLLLIGLVAASAVIVSGCSSSSRPGQTVKISASWAVTYHDLKSLKQGSDIAAVGSISEVANVTREGPGRGDVTTDFVFSISKVILDPGQRVKGSSLTIHQVGGVMGDTLYEVEDDPLFQVGEHLILFLHEYSPGHYYVAGGPTGRFEIRNNMVTPVNDEGVKFSAPMTEADFIAAIQSA